MMKENLKSIVEALLFASEKPLDAGDIFKIIQRVELENVIPLHPLAAQENAEETSEGVEEISPSPENTEEVLEASDEVSGEEKSAEEQLMQKQEEEDDKLGRGDVQEVILELIEEYQNNPVRGFELVKVAHAYQFRTKTSVGPYVRAMSKVAPTRLSQAALETLSIIAYRQPITRVEIDQVRGVDSGGVVKSLSDRELIRIVGKKDEPGRPLLYGTTEGFLEIFNLGSLQELPSLKELHQIEEEMKRSNPEDANVIQLSSEEEDEVAEVEAEMELHFADLEKDEEEAFSELDEEIDQLLQFDEQVKTTLNPKVEENSDPEL